MATARFSAGEETMFGTHVRVSGGKAYTQPNARMTKTYWTMWFFETVTTICV